jgi:4-hydroxy-4-methyl-2-oxoglutarate aldolase
MADPAATLSALGAATIGESGATAMAPRIRPAWSGGRLAAPAFTVRCTPGDNLAIHVAVARAAAGSAVVVDVGGERERGYWGEVLTTAAEARGIAGLVIDGCVRDLSALEAHAFPVFATGIALRGATKQLRGALGERVEVGDAPVEPGDWIVGDVDGVVVVPRAKLESVLEAARSRSDVEQAAFVALRSGATTVELLGLDESLVDGP